MDAIFHYESYKDFILDYRTHLPGGGRGFFQKMSEALGVVPVLISQIFKGDRELNPEQAIELCEFLKLSKIEAKFFCLLVHKSRAGSAKLRAHLQEEIDELRRDSLELSSHLPKDAKLDEKTKAVFYSSWAHSAIRLCTDIEAFKSVDRIAERLNLPKEKVSEIVQFLLKNGLVVNSDHRLKLGPQRTHLESSSPWVRQHHQNWRQRSVEKMLTPDKTDLFYTGPMVLSHKDYLDIREILAKQISEIIQIVSASKSEDIYCLNLDWFRLPEKP
jgi:uncharacterized protein (TIGR02147 family)